MIPSLVFDSGRNGLGLIRSLGKENIPVFAVNPDKAISTFSRYCKWVACPPRKNENEFIDFLIRLGKKINRGVLFPDSDQLVLTILKHKKTLEKYYKIPLPNKEIIQNTLNKKNLYKFAIKNNIDIPKTYFPDEESIKQISEKINYPCIIKPVNMHLFVEKFGTKLFKVNSQKELLKKYADLNDVVIQEVIKGDSNLLYSFLSYTNKKSQVLAGFTGRKLKQYPDLMFGESSLSESVWEPEIAELGKTIIKKSKYHGLSQIEFKRDLADNKFKLLDFNTRSWSWNSLATECGINLPYIAYKDLLNEEIKMTIGETEKIKWLFGSMLLLSFIKSKDKNIFRWFKLLKGKKTYAIFSKSDPMPFFVSLLRRFSPLTIPRVIKKLTCS